MTTVSELLPGDYVLLDSSPTLLGNMGATFVVSTDHPRYRDFALVVWILDDGTPSFDALLPIQEVGQAQPSTAQQRADRLEAVLTPGRL
jgi:hypothetical protein